MVETNHVTSESSGSITDDTNIHINNKHAIIFFANPFSCLFLFLAIKAAIFVTVSLRPIYVNGLAAYWLHYVAAHLRSSPGRNSETAEWMGRAETLQAEQVDIHLWYRKGEISNNGVNKLRGLQRASKSFILNMKNLFFTLITAIYSNITVKVQLSKS